jgi:RNA polymerase-binding protein DksA
MVKASAAKENGAEKAKPEKAASPRLIQGGVGHRGLVQGALVQSKLVQRKLVQGRPVAGKLGGGLGKATVGKLNKNMASKQAESEQRKPADKVKKYAPPEEEKIEIPIVTAVPTNGKPRKNMAGFSSKELELFRDALLAKRREIVGDMSSMEREALRSSGGSNLSNLPLHMADMGTDNYEQEFTLGLMEKDRKLLRDLNDALAKIQNGTYGLCEGTGKPISKARLEAQPWARYSIEWARKLEGRLR